MLAGIESSQRIFKRRRGNVRYEIHVFDATSGHVLVNLKCQLNIKGNVSACVFLPLSHADAIDYVVVQCGCKKVRPAQGESKAYWLRKLSSLGRSKPSW